MVIDARDKFNKRRADADKARGKPSGDTKPAIFAEAERRKEVLREALAKLKEKKDKGDTL